MAAPDLAPLIHGAPLHGARLICVFIHGRGQTPEDMQADVTGRMDVPGVAYVLPRAAGKSWYKARAVDPLTDVTRAELRAALDGLGALLAGLPAVPVLLAGFSQGACVALEYAFRGGLRPGALVALTGARVGTTACARPAADLAGMPALLTGSDADPWIPPQAFADAVGALTMARAALRAESYPGRSHMICAAERTILSGMLHAMTDEGPR